MRAVQRTFSWLFLIALCVGAMSCSATDQTTSPAPLSSVTVLNDDASQLREDFNRARGSVRLVLIVDPLCAVCLRGMADVNDALLATTTDARLQTFVVHVPVLGATAKDIPPSMELMHNPNVHHYWNPSGNFGRQVQDAFHLEHGGKPVYAWDVWMIYAADATWPAGTVSTPALFMHQLSTLRGQPGRPFLDKDAFAAKARTLLNSLPSAPTGN
jgi:hypothetical protein